MSGNIPRKSAAGRERMRAKMQSGRMLRTAKLDPRPKRSKRNG